mgnify:CR=1 FL=1
MINLNDKQERLALIERYLAADTTVQEEQMLAEYYASHQPDADEEQIAALIKLSHPNASDIIDTAEFDRITVHRKPVQMILRWSSVAAAAIVLLLVCLHIGKPALPEETASTMSTVQILEGMEMISRIEMGEIESVLAKPQGDRVVITVKLANGKERSYSMSSDVDGNSLSFTAFN